MLPIWMFVLITSQCKNLSLDTWLNRHSIIVHSWQGLSRENMTEFCFLYYIDDRRNRHWLIQIFSRLKIDSLCSCKIREWLLCRISLCQSIICVWSLGRGLMQGWPNFLASGPNYRYKSLGGPNLNFARTWRPK